MEGIDREDMMALFQKEWGEFSDGRCFLVRGFEEISFLNGVFLREGFCL